MKILLPLDLVHPVEPIIDTLETLIDLKSADVKLLYVHEILPAYENALRLSEEKGGDWQKEYDQKSGGKLAEVETLLKPRCKSVTHQIAHGSKAMTIENVARSENFDVIALAPRRKHDRKVFSTSITNKVVQHGPGTVLVLRRPVAKNPVVVIGTDGSANAEYAIKTAAKTLHLTKAKQVIVVHAVDIPEPIKYFSPVEFVASLEKNALMEGEAFLARAEKLLADAGVKNIELRLIEDDPAEGVVKMAEETNADLVIVGAQGHSAVQHFLLGSVSHKIATHLDCSVAVVKPKK
jgi:nucleotide-binding universal stress UspA family protein